MVNKPTLLVIAGCNGSGKSTYSITLAEGIIPFDYDKHFLRIYNSKFDSELRELMSHNEARQLLENSIDRAISEKTDFCYETNFNSFPMHWPNIFKENGYQIYMVYFCLNSIAEAKRRVKIRYENKGHFVPDHEVEERFNLGYENLDTLFDQFDNIELFDSSENNAPPSHVLSIVGGEIENISKFPPYLEALLPNINNCVNLYLKINTPPSLI